MTNPPPPLDVKPFRLSAFRWARARSWNVANETAAGLPARHWWRGWRRPRPLADGAAAPLAFVGQWSDYLTMEMFEKAKKTKLLEPC